jgi:exonuclease III
MTLSKLLCLLFFYVCMVYQNGLVFGQEILIDEDFSDWSNVESFTTDAEGDGANNGIDFTFLYAANDEEYLYLYFDTGAEINLQSGNLITLFIDIDNNPGTGIIRNGIGADLRYNLGTRNGIVFLPSSTVSISHTNILLVTSPTVTSTQFELAISRTILLEFSSITLADRIKIILEDTTPGGDRIPNTTGGFEYAFKEIGPRSLPSFELHKPPFADFRLLSYNVERDNIFDPNLQDQYRRILQAIQPDIIGFSEIYDHSSAQTGQLIEQWLPSGPGQAWFRDGVWPDIKLISRYPIRKKVILDGNGAFLLEHPETEILVIVVHLPCCENDTGRAREIDRIMAFIRDAKSDANGFGLKKDTPVIICGDFNLVGDRSQIESLLDGRISNTTMFGGSFNPDWDGNPFRDALPYTTGTPMSYTWYATGSSFSPGRLDYTIYSGSVLKAINGFNLDTRSLDLTTLAASNLFSQDSYQTSDHLPQVVDFVLEKRSNTSGNYINDMGLNMYPNPAQYKLELEWSSKNEIEYIEIYSSDGKLIKKVSLKDSPSASSYYKLDLYNFSDGLHFLLLKGVDGTYPAKFIIAK